MIDETLIKKIRELNEMKKSFEYEINQIKEKIDEIDKDLEPLRVDLLNNMIVENFDEYHGDNDLVVLRRNTITKGYSKDEEKQILDILKNLNLNKCINLKESLSKRELTKELKTNNELNDLIKDFGQEKKTEFVQVMTEDELQYLKEQMNK